MPCWSLSPFAQSVVHALGKPNCTHLGPSCFSPWGHTATRAGSAQPPPSCECHRVFSSHCEHCAVLWFAFGACPLNIHHCAGSASGLHGAVPSHCVAHRCGFAMEQPGLSLAIALGITAKLRAVQRAQGPKNTAGPCRVRIGLFVIPA